MAEKNKVTEQEIIREARKYDFRQGAEMLFQYALDHSGLDGSTPLSQEEEYNPIIPNPVKPSCTCRPRKKNIETVGIEPIKQNNCVPVTQCGSSGNFVPKCTSLAQFKESEYFDSIQDSCSCECVPADDTYKCECDSFNCDDCNYDIDGFVSYGDYTSIPVNPKIHRCCDECCTDDGDTVDIDPGDDDSSDDDFDPTLTAGCTDIYAANFDADAETDDGSCCYDNVCLIAQGLDPIYGTEVGGGLPGDVTGDGQQNVLDIVWLVNCILGGDNPNFDMSDCDPIPGYYIPPYHDCEDEDGCGNGESCCDELSCCDGEGMDCLPDYYIDPQSCPETCVGCDWQTLSENEFFEALQTYMVIGYSADQGHTVFPAGPYTDLQSWISYQAGIINNWDAFYSLFDSLFGHLTQGDYPGIGTNFIDTYCPSLPVLGCTDGTACNFDSNAEQNDGSCIYPPYGLGCNCSYLEIIGNCWNSNVPYCQEGFCDEVVVGCMDSSACNYNPSANVPCDSSSVESTEPMSGQVSTCRFTNPNIYMLCPTAPGRVNEGSSGYYKNKIDYENGVGWIYDVSNNECYYDTFGQSPLYSHHHPDTFINYGSSMDDHHSYKIDDYHHGFGDIYIDYPQWSHKINLLGYRGGWQEGDDLDGSLTRDAFCSDVCAGTVSNWSAGTIVESGKNHYGFIYHEGMQGAWRWANRTNVDYEVSGDDGWIDCNCQQFIPGVCDETEETQVLTTEGPNDCCCYIGDSSSPDGSDCEIDLSAEGTCACDGTINYGCGCNNVPKLTYYRDDDGDGMGCGNQPADLCPDDILVSGGTYVQNYDDDECDCPNTCGGEILGTIIFGVGSGGMCKVCTTPGGGPSEQEHVNGTYGSPEECCAAAFGVSFSDDISVEVSDDCTVNNSWIGYQCTEGVLGSCIDGCGACVPEDEGSLDWNATCSGCTNQNACNYDSSALFDDSSCVLPTSTTCYHQYESVSQCYDSTVSIDLCAGDCTLLGDGWFNSLSNSLTEIDCIDSTSCNYTDPTSYGDCYINLNNCEYPQENFDCDGNCIVDIDECGVCGGSGIPDGECDCFGNTLDECGVCGGNNALDLGCGCGVSGTIMYWPDEDSDGLAQGEGFEWCSEIGNITSITCADFGVHAGTGNCLVPESGWEDHCSNLDTTTNICNEEQDPDCQSFTYDCFGECDGSATTDDCGVCEGGNADQNICGVCFEPDPEPIYNCAGECVESIDRYGDCCYSSDLDECDICFGNNDKDLCGVCIADGGDNSSCSGCTDPNATNYDSSATVDNGTCQYIDGCMDSTADNYDSNATADDGTCCNFSDLNNQQALACNYLIDNSTYCDTATSTAYYDLYCTNSTDFVDASTHVPTVSVDRFVGDTPALDAYGYAQESAFVNLNYVAYTLQEESEIGILSTSFYSEKPQTFTEFGGTLSDYNTYLQGIMVELSDAFAYQLTVSKNTIVEESVTNMIETSIYYGSVCDLFFGADNCSSGWSPKLTFSPGQGFLLLAAANSPGTYIKFKDFELGT